MAVSGFTARNQLQQEEDQPSIDAASHSAANRWSKLPLNGDAPAFETSGVGRRLQQATMSFPTPGTYLESLIRFNGDCWLSPGAGG
jgi:hypothetical protein